MWTEKNKLTTRRCYAVRAACVRGSKSPWDYRRGAGHAADYEASMQELAAAAARDDQTWIILCSIRRSYTYVPEVFSTTARDIARLNNNGDAADSNAYGTGSFSESPYRAYWSGSSYVRSWVQLYVHVYGLTHVASARRLPSTVSWMHGWACGSRLSGEGEGPGGRRRSRATVSSNAIGSNVAS